MAGWARLAAPLPLVAPDHQHLDQLVRMPEGGEGGSGASPFSFVQSGALGEDEGDPVGPVKQHRNQEEGRSLALATLPVTSGRPDVQDLVRGRSSHVGGFQGGDSHRVPGRIEELDLEPGASIVHVHNRADVAALESGFRKIPGQDHTVELVHGSLG
jgi:hypothetical protein